MRELNILVFGANGPLGRQLIQYILNNAKHTAIALLENRAQSAYFTEKGIENYLYSTGDSLEVILSTAPNVDAIVIAEHIMDDLVSETIVEIDETIKLLEALKNTPLKRMVHISSFETRKEEWIHLPVYFRPIMIKNYYVDQWLRQSSLDYTIIHPGNLNDKKGTGFVKVDDRDISIGDISREDVAKIVLACLENQSTIRKEFKVVSGKQPIEDAINMVI